MKYSQGTQSWTVRIKLSEQKRYNRNILTKSVKLNGNYT